MRHNINNVFSIMSNKFGKKRLKRVYGHANKYPDLFFLLLGPLFAGD
jgi:hypothetical protein